ncbi:MAG: mannose-6-phosphate isomerase, class I [Treponema sp.]|jgi:mannose-6-phosphate isomerase|nr:mannose-6-phosphate isomerase, class I [Treponema sp.]
MSPNDLRLEILGTSFTISADEERSYLEKLLQEYYLKVRDMQKSTGLKDPLKIAILTGFTLCDELHRVRHNAHATEEEEALQRTINLFARLDETIGKDKNGTVQALYFLENPVKHYEWGSPSWIPRLLRRENPTGEPWAELWMGVHPAAPSMLKNQPPKSLAQLIAADPPCFVGKEAAVNFGGLPFLFKLLAAARPLSIQAHPSKEQARQGWQRENAQDTPERNYKDDNHKPEILCALSPFTALCGFRYPKDIDFLIFTCFAAAPRSLQNGLAPLRAALTDGRGSPLRDFLAGLLGMPKELREQLTAYVSTEIRNPPEIDGSIWPLVQRLAKLYPEDPGILAPLYLNLIRLEPGQAIYLPEGILHAYMDGFGVELMANSDNVLRCGLTSKHVDLNELMNVLYFHPFMPDLLTDRPGAAPADPVFFSYPSPCKEFSLSVIRNLQGPFPLPGPAIIVVTAGRLAVSRAEAAGPDSDACWEFEPGGSAFIPPSPEPLILSGDFTLYAASIPAGR